MSTGQPNYAAGRPQAFQVPTSSYSPRRQGHTMLSSRSSYPTFLSVHESVLLQLTWAWRGLYDAFRWNIVIGAVASDSEIRANVYKSVLLNSLSLVSIYIFDLLLQPLVRDQQKWFHRNIGWFYQVLWLLPVVGTSLYLNGTWCTIIAKRTYLLQHGGRPAVPQTTSYTGMLKAIATSAYRVVMVCTSVVMSFALQRIPIIGSTVGFVFLCWVDAYYCFEFVWIARDFSLSRRIRHLEERWAYYFAFGFPSAALCTWGTGLANAALFALVFPMFIIMAMHAKPVPSDSYNPAPPLAAQRVGESDVIRHPSPFVPIRLPIFALVIMVNDAVVRVLNFVGGRPIVRHQGAAGVGATRSRAFSDASESAEDGVAGGVHMEMKPVSTRTRMSSSTASSTSTASPNMRATSGRVKIGTRRKAD